MLSLQSEVNQKQMNIATTKFPEIAVHGYESERGVKIIVFPNETLNGKLSLELFYPLFY